MPHSLDSQTIAENPGSSFDDEDDGENGQHHLPSDAAHGSKNGQSYGRFEGTNGGERDEEDEEDEDEEGEANEEEGEQDDGKP